MQLLPIARSAVLPDVGKIVGKRKLRIHPIDEKRNPDPTSSARFLCALIFLYTPATSALCQQRTYAIRHC